MKRFASLIILFLFGIHFFGINAEAKPFSNIIVTTDNQDSFWDVLPTKGRVITCYLSNEKRYPGKKSSVVLNGVAGNIWKDDRLKLGKVLKKFGKLSNKYKSQKKKTKSNKKLCNNSTPPSNTPTPTPTPTPEPQPVIECGNGLLEGSEVCDDGNKVNGDGCSNLCLNEKCGDGILQPALGEQCDDGNQTIGDGCSATCTVDGTLLPPGSGFPGATTEPGAVGNPAAYGYSAKAIAHWDTVPYQTFYDEMNVSVVAFHTNGIDKVEFAANGGAWVSKTTMTLNPQTGVYEYWVKLRATDFSDGIVEVRAIAYPTIGEPRLLESLYLNANKNLSLPNNIRYVSPGGNDTTGEGTLSKPYLSIMKGLKELQIANGNGNADGGSLYLLSGNHNYGTYSASLDTTTVNRWATLRPAPGLSKTNVTLSVTGAVEGLKTKLVRLDDLTIKTELKSDSALEDYLWISNSKLQGVGRDTIVGTNGFVSSSSGWTDSFLTDSTVLQHKNSPPAKIVRNVAISDIGADAFSGARLAVNSSVDGIDASGTAFSPHVINFDLSGGTVENRIYYGITALNATVLGLHVDGAGTGILNNVAFVNFLLDYLPGDTIEFSEWKEVVSSHILFWHVTCTQELMWGTARGNLSNLSVKNNAWKGFTVFGDAGSDVLDDQEVNYNHFVNSGMLNFTSGTNISTGSPGYTDEGNDDFVPSGSSILKDRSTVILTPIDLDSNTRSNPVSLGAYE